MVEGPWHRGNVHPCLESYSSAKRRKYAVPLNSGPIRWLDTHGASQISSRADQSLDLRLARCASCPSAHRLQSDQAAGDLSSGAYNRTHTSSFLALAISQPV